MPDKQPENSQKKGRADHLKGYRFKPGNSGNPGGRKAGGASLIAAIRRGATREAVDQVAEKIWERATAGERWAAEFVTKVIDAKFLRDSLNGCAEDGTVTIVVRYQDQSATTSDDEP